MARHTIKNRKSRIKHRVYLSFGSNLGDRVKNLRRALEKLAEAGVETRRVSSFYKTEPVDFLPQPWFVNCAAEAGTDLAPLELLKTLKGVEWKLGRRASKIRNGPRRIDIDILLYENVVVRTPVLVIPHPRLAERRFVLVPLGELAPWLRHPISRRTVLRMLRETKDASQVVRLRKL